MRFASWRNSSIALGDRISSALRSFTFVHESSADSGRRGFVGTDRATDPIPALQYQRGLTHLCPSQPPLSSLNSDGADHPVSDGIVERGPLVGTVRELAIGRPAFNSMVSEESEVDEGGLILKG